MAEINTTINIHVDGVLYPLNKMIKEVNPVAAQPSVIDQIATPSGKGFYTGDIFKMIKRPQVDSTASVKRGGLGGFVGASSQELHSVFVGKTNREDNIVFNEADLAKLKEAKGGNIIALETGNFIITGRELDTKILLTKLQDEADGVKLFTAVNAATGLPAGNQPTAAVTNIATAITAIDGGKRVISISDAELDKEIDGRLQIIRAGVQYLFSLGTEDNTEADYAYSINGFATNRLKLLSNYKNNVKLKEKDTQRFIQVSGANAANITGIVGYLDNDIAVLQTNQLKKGTKYALMTDRVLVRDLDPEAQYIGKVRDAAVTVDRDGNTVALKPNERLMQYLQGRTQAVRYASEAFFITD